MDMILSWKLIRDQVTLADRRESRPDQIMIGQMGRPIQWRNQSSLDTCLDKKIERSGNWGHSKSGRVDGIHPSSFIRLLYVVYREFQVKWVRQDRRKTANMVSHSGRRRVSRKTSSPGITLQRMMSQGSNSQTCSGLEFLLL